MPRKTVRAVVIETVRSMDRPFTAEMVQLAIFQSDRKNVPSRSSITNIIRGEHLAVKVGNLNMTLKEGYQRRPTLYEVVV